MVVQFSHVGKRNFMSGDSNDFKLKNLFNNPDLEFTHKKSGDKVTITSKPKFEGNLFSTLQSNKSNPNGLDERFGWENDWSPDGQILAVGSPFYETSTTINVDSGRVYFYKFEELTKSNPQPFNILQRNDVRAHFGSYVRWSPDGTKLAVGARRNNNSSNLIAGSVFIYNLTDIINKQNPNPSVEISPTTLSLNAYFGTSLNWNYDGSQLAIGAVADQNNIGSVYVYNTNDLTKPVNIIIPSGRTNFSDTSFGYKVEFDSNNKYLAVGAYAYDKGSLVPKDDDSGAIYIYSTVKLKTTSNPIPDHILVAQTNSESLGWDFKWSPNGKYLAAGAQSASNGTPVESYGKVYIYKIDDLKLSTPLPIILSVKNSSGFGVSVDWNKSSTRLAVGSNSDDNGTNSQGSVYIFDTNQFVSEMSPIQKIFLKDKIIINSGDEGFGRGLRWHPSNRYLAVNSYRNNNYSGSLYILH